MENDPVADRETTEITKDWNRDSDDEFRVQQGNLERKMELIMKRAVPTDNASIINFISDHEKLVEAVNFRKE